MGSVRRQVRIARPADEVWAVVGDAPNLHRWFPGMVSSPVEGAIRTVTTGTGLSIPEEILCNDPILRRFQYRITAPILQDHRGTIDVFDLGDGTSLVSYATDGSPDAMVLMIGGATGAALLELKRQLEAPTEGADA